MSSNYHHPPPSPPTYLSSASRPPSSSATTDRSESPSSPTVPDPHAWSDDGPVYSSPRRSSTQRDHNRRLSAAMRRRQSSSAAMNQQAASSSSSWRTLPRRSWAAYMRTSGSLMAKFWKLTPAQRAVTVAAIALGWVSLVLMVIYTQRFFTWLRPVAKTWRDSPGGWVLVFLIIFVTSFPPLIGYGTANTVAGFVYGVGKGWLIASAACTLGSLFAFLASRTILSTYVHRMVGKDHRFVALGQVLRREGLMYLTLIRLCPLPFSLSNGFMATIPSVSPTAFTIATFLSSPKLLIHVFVGSRIAILAENNKMTVGDKAINYLSMAVGVVISAGVGLIIYRRTMARAAELADHSVDAEEGHGSGDPYEDSSNVRLLDPEDAAAVMSDDDVSLWEARPDDAFDDAFEDGDGTPGARKDLDPTGS